MAHAVDDGKGSEAFECANDKGTGAAVITPHLITLNGTLVEGSVVGDVDEDEFSGFDDGVSEDSEVAEDTDEDAYINQDNIGEATMLV